MTNNGNDSNIIACSLISIYLPVINFNDSAFDDNYIHRRGGYIRFNGSPPQTLLVIGGGADDIVHGRGWMIYTCGQSTC